MITIDELKAKLGGMKTSVDDLRDALSIEASEKRLAELEHQMTLPGFYDDQARSQKIISEMGEVKNKLERFGKLKTQYEEAETLLEMIEEENDPALAAEGEEAVEGVEKSIDELQLMTMTDAIRYLKEKYVIQDSLAQMRTEVYAIVRRRYRQEVAAKKGAGACLERLHTQGMRIGVLTACERVCAEEVLKRNGLLEYMNFVASCEELPYDKQDGRLFELMPAMLHTDKAETMFVEDALHAVQTLKTHGFHVTAVYDAASKAHWKEICMQADAAFLSLDDLKGE